MNFENLNISNIVHEISRQLSDHEPRRKVTFSIEENIIVNGDKRLLRIALQNLLENAWKFTSGREHGEIAFGQMPHNEIHEYFVRDNGAGFDMTYADKLFGVFQPLQSLEEFDGRGIGLVTVQRIVHRHGGLIRAEGQSRRGCIFLFYI